MSSADSQTLNEIWETTCAAYTGALTEEYERVVEHLQILQNHITVALRARYSAGEPLPTEAEILAMFRSSGTLPVK
ncbi:Hypothetical protein GLP15_2499 [Giardia lamblia P15]|uniref:Uncharacterized protein n=1 Tax=Giardia intestinalis (strain P15) TaxID=658858 RepID=E1EWG7_GIAIA|nr:Hypothetical protein GLP15_2499 [Giardia lamblia P15]